MNVSKRIASTCDRDFNTRLAVATGTCGALTELRDNNNGGRACPGSARASVNSLDVGGQTHRLLVGGSGPLAFGTCRIEVTMAPPASDVCAVAIALSGGAPYAASTMIAGAIGDPTNTYGSNEGSVIWYTYTRTVPNPVSVGACGEGFAATLSINSLPLRPQSFHRGRKVPAVIS